MKRPLITLSAILTLTSAAIAADPTTTYNIDKSKLALAGYDPVSYFRSGPAEGKREITSQFEGITYRFANADNKKEFDASPAKYKPTYGGWCATAMAEGKKVEVDPKNYKIVNGRLYLFFKAWYHDALTDWNKDEKKLKTQADAAWKKISGE
jgi:YHS domain-containing protein